MGTIAEEISSLQGRIADAYVALSRKGAEQPLVEDTWHLEETIDSIPTEKYRVMLNGILGSVFDGELRLPEQTFQLGFDDPPVEITCIAEEALRCKFFREPMLDYINTYHLQVISSYGMYQMCPECSALTAADFPELKVVGPYGLANAFNTCNALSSMALSSVETVETYGMQQMCYVCSSLVEVDLSRLTSLGTYGLQNAFRSCTSLTSVNMSSLASAPTQSFSGTFQGCTSLQVVRLTKLSNAGTRLQNVLNNAFSGCTSLSVVDFSQATAVPVLANVNTFSSTNDYYKIVVPDSLYDTWIAATNWSNSAIKPRIVKVSDFPV